MLFFYVIDLISPPAGRNNSGANWRKRDVCGPVQGAVAVGEWPQGILRPLRGHDGVMFDDR